MTSFALAMQDRDDAGGGSDLDVAMRHSTAAPPAVSATLRRLQPSLRRILCATAILLAAGAGRADVFVVDTNADSSGGSCPADLSALPGSAGSCSLRDAIEAANASAGDDRILFAPAVFSSAANRVITLASPLPAFEEDVEINAVSPPLLSQRVQGIVVRAGAGVATLFAVSGGTSELDDVTLEDAGVTVDAGASLVFTQSVDASYAEGIAGGGSVEKRGTARLVLTGTNTYTGETVVDAGALQGDTLAIPGDVDDDALLVFDQEMADPEDFLGAISGTGSVQKIGEGTLFLKTANSYSGGTTISDGTLRGFAGNGMTGGSLQGDILNDAELVFEQDADGTFAGDITGSGSLVKNGTGVLVLTGSNGYGGGTTITAGSLRGAAGAIQGDVAIGSGAKLLFDQPAAGTHAGDITGGGGLGAGEFSLEKLGAGTLTLTGSNDYLGGTLVSGGTLVGDTQSLQRNITLATGTTLVFDQAFADAFTGLLDGNGALEKRGAGTLVLTSDLTSAGFAPGGPTTIAGGRLDVGRPVDGTLARLPGDVSILAGGVLGGIGRVDGLVTAQSGAAISPGNSLGVLLVGDATFRTGSFLEVEVTPAPAADLLDVTGTATIEPGAQVRVIPGPGDYPALGAGTPVVILDAGTRLGDFDPFPAGSFAFLEVTLEQIAHQVLLTVESNGNTLVDVAATPNQLAVAEALDTAQAGGDLDVGDVFGELNTLSVPGVRSALDAMAGEQLTQFATARLAVGQRFHAAIQERIRAGVVGERAPLFTRSGGPGPSLAASPLRLAALRGAGSGLPTGALAAAGFAMQQGAQVFVPAPETTGLGGWLDGFGSFGDVSAGSGTDGFDTTVWGASAGLDFRPGGGFVAGLAGGWAHSRLDFDSLDGRPEADTAQGAAYLGYASPRVEAGAAFRFAWNRMSAERGIEFAPPSTLARRADSEFDGIDLGGHVEAALDLVELAGVSVQPLAAFTYAHLQQDAFDESGAGSLDLSADEETLDSAVSGLGLRLHAEIQLDEATSLRPELRARWLHEFGDRERKLEARIGGTPGAAFTVRGTELPRDSASVGVGWRIVVLERLFFFTEYDLAVNPDLLQHTAALGLEVVW